jgi:hypothetical protein
VQRGFSGMKWHEKDEMKKKMKNINAKIIDEIKFHFSSSHN